MTERFEDFLRRREQASNDYIRGDAAALAGMLTQYDPATFMPPTGAMFEHADQVAKAQIEGPKPSARTAEATSRSSTRVPPTPSASGPAGSMRRSLFLIETHRSTWCCGLPKSSDSRTASGNWSTATLTPPPHRRVERAHVRDVRWTVVADRDAKSILLRSWKLGLCPRIDTNQYPISADH
jgi:hypothetical protein